MHVTSFQLSEFKFALFLTNIRLKFLSNFCIFSGTLERIIVSLHLYDINKVTLYFKYSLSYFKLISGQILHFCLIISMTQI